MRIGWDLDGVGYRFKEANCEFEVARGNLHRSLERAGEHFEYYESWGDLTRSEWLQSYAEGVDAGHILWKGEPFPDCVDVAKQFEKDGHENVVVTFRTVGKEPEAATTFWLDGIDFPYHELHFHRDKTLVPTDVFIEDNIENADALNAAGTRAYLINRSWNAPFDDGRLRVDNLWQFYKEVTS